MEERVKYLENELHNFAQSFQELTYHYSILHNFLLAHFGETFKKFVLDESGTAADDGGEILGLMGDEGEEVSADDNEQDDYEEDDGNGIECPTDILDINVDHNEENGEEDEGEEEDEVNDEERPHIRITSIPQSFNRNGTGNTVNRRLIQDSPHVKVETRATTSSGGLRVVKMPPPLIRRPGTTMSSQLHPRTHVQTSNNGGQRIVGNKGQHSTTTVTIRPVIGGNRGNEVLLSNDDEDFKAGKYAKFYKKVNDELIQCKMCHKILKRRGKFIQHLRTHTGEKPFQCQYCPAAFSRKDNMNVHVAKHHSPGESQNGHQNRTLSMQLQSQYRTSSASSSSKSLYGYKCQFCSKLFANESIFQAHVKLVHSSNDNDYENQEGDEETMEMEDGYEEADYLAEEVEDEDDYLLHN